MSEKQVKISLQTEVVLSLKTIATVFISVGTLLWGAYEFVLDKRLGTLEEDVHGVELKIDKVYDHMIGIGGATNDDVKSAETPIEEDENKGTL